MKRAILIKSVLSLLLLLMAACAPSSKRLIDGGKVMLKYYARPSEIMQLIRDSSSALALPSNYESVVLTELSDGVIELSAKNLDPSSPKNSLTIKLTVEQRNSYTHVIIMSNAGRAAESLQNEIIKLLDNNYLRYHEGLFPKKQQLTLI